MLLFALAIFSCNTTEPPGDSIELMLKLEDVSCTETWLTLSTTNLHLPAEVNIKRTDADGNSVSQISILNTQDTLLYIDSLLPNTTYTFYAQTSSRIPVTSNKIQAATMDTTSHNFTFETYTFGGGGEASFINDVTIIDENNIWACGEIYLPDSLGNPDTDIYNAIHWDGEKWEPKRIKVYVNKNLVTLPLFGAFAFSAEDIWFSAGVPIHGDGRNWTQYHLFDMDILTQDDGSVYKIWGKNSADLYFVGNRGTIAHHTGQSPEIGWQKIESGTRTIINDAWGITNENNEATVYCPVSSFFTPGDKKILRIKNNKVDSVSWSINRRPHSVWTNSDFILYVCGEGIFENKNNNWKEINITSVASNKIRGNDLNDIFVIGDFGFAAHYNGISWKTYDNLFNFNSGFRSISVKENIVAIVGRNNGYGIVTIGRRN